MEINWADIFISHFALSHRLLAAVEVYVETGVIVYLEHPRFELLVDQQVQSQDLERLADNVVFTCHCIHLMLDHGAVNLHHLCTSVVDRCLDRINIDAILPKRVVKRRKSTLCPLVAHKDVLSVGVHVAVVGLVDRVVCQVHESLLEVRLCWCFVASLYEREKTCTLASI